MKVEIQREPFLAAFASIAGLVPARSPKPILQNMKLVVGDNFTPAEDGPTLMASDLEIGIRRRVAGVRVIEGGAVILPPGRLGPILRQATCEYLTIETEGDTIKIRGKKVKYDLPSEDPDLFPDPQVFDAAAYHQVNAIDLARLIGLTMFAVDEKSTRYALGGVLTEMNPSSITMVGTDGKRLAEARAKVDVVGEPPTYRNGATGDDVQAPVVPLKALRLLRGLIAHTKPSDPPVAIAVGKHQTGVIFQSDRATMVARVIEGRFPRYADVFPSGQGTIVELKANEFTEAVSQAAIATSTEATGIDFHLAPGRLTLNAQAYDVGKSEVEMDLPDYSGPDAEVTFGAPLLMDALKAIDPGATIRADFRPDEGNLFKVGDDYNYILMPLTRDR